MDDIIALKDKKINIITVFIYQPRLEYRFNHNYMLSRNNSLEVKGVAILFMIFFHLFGFPERIPIENVSQWMGNPIIKAFQICVPIYLFISGYGLQCTAI